MISERAGNDTQEVGYYYSQTHLTDQGTEARGETEARRETEARGDYVFWVAGLGWVLNPGCLDPQLQKLESPRKVFPRRDRLLVASGKDRHSA